MTKSIL